MSSEGDSLNPGLLDVLACPRCGDRPPLKEDGNSLRCAVCGAGYPVKNGIPHLLPEDAIFESETEK